MIKIFIPRAAEKQVQVLHNAFIVVVASGNGRRRWTKEIPPAASNHLWQVAPWTLLTASPQKTGVFPLVSHTSRTCRCHYTPSWTILTIFSHCNTIILVITACVLISVGNDVFSRFSWCVSPYFLIKFKTSISKYFPRYPTAIGIERVPSWSPSMDISTQNVVIFYICIYKVWSLILVLH